MIEPTTNDNWFHKTHNPRQPISFLLVNLNESNALCILYFPAPKLPLYGPNIHSCWNKWGDFQLFPLASSEHHLSIPSASNSQKTIPKFPLSEVKFSTLRRLQEMWCTKLIRPVMHKKSIPALTARNHLSAAENLTSEEVDRQCPTK